MQTWRDRVVLITGAGSGIGRALAEALSARGARVIAADIDAAAAAATVAELAGGARAIALDVTDGEGFRRAVDEIIAREGRIDALFNNAGIGMAGAAEDLALRDWRRVVEVDLIGVMNGIAAVYPHFVAEKSGLIVNTASGAGLAPRPGMAAYAAAKHGVIGLTTSLRAEAAMFGVEVCAICPGYVETGIAKSSHLVNLDGAALMNEIPIAPMSAAKCAELALRGVEKGRAIIAISAYVYLDWWLFRLSPALSTFMARWRARKFRAHRGSPTNPSPPRSESARETAPTSSP